MRRDAVSPGLGGHAGGADRIRMGNAAGVPNGGDVINIDAKTQYFAHIRLLKTHSSHYLP
jgi:hypothetical protein